MKDDKGPDFFVIGAMKCGTTSFANALRAHPQIFVPYEKSLNYFSVGLSPTLEPGFFPLSKRAVRTSQQYQAAFRAASPGQIRGDFSETSYCVPGTAARIAQSCPNAKIVLLTRCPVARAYSSFNHARGHAMEPCEDFEQAFFRSETAETPPMLRYRSLGMFHHLLGPYRQRFRDDQIQVVRLADLHRTPDVVLRNIQDFLGVAPCELVLPRSNSARVPNCMLANPLFKQAFMLSRPTISRLTKHKSIRKVAKTVQKTAFGRPKPLSRDLVKKLSAAFAADQDALRDYLDQTSPVSEDAVRAFAGR